MKPRLQAIAQRRAAQAEQQQRRSSLRAVSDACAKVDMRVPVFISELAVGIHMALHGQNGMLQAMVAHNRRLALSGVKGAFEQ